MDNNNFDKIIEHSLSLRKKYHELELSHHGSEKQGRWPKAGTDTELKHKKTLSVANKKHLQITLIDFSVINPNNFRASFF